MTSTPGDRRSRRAARRAEARKASAGGPSTPRWLLPALIGGAVVVALAIALVLPGMGGPSGGGSSREDAGHQRRASARLPGADERSGGRDARA
jgi:hypothetical protein